MRRLRQWWWKLEYALALGSLSKAISLAAGKSWCSSIAATVELK
jgi:hypothetical protein